MHPSSTSLLFLHLLLVGLLLSHNEPVSAFPIPSNKLSPSSRHLPHSNTLLRWDPSSQTTTRTTTSSISSRRRRWSNPTVLGLSMETERTTTTTTPEEKLDQLLEQGDLARAVQCFQEYPQLNLTRARWDAVFDTIVLRTRQEEADVNQQLQQQSFDTVTTNPSLSPARQEMSRMYNTLAELDHLRLFGGALSKTQFPPEPPASGSHTVTPMLLQHITNLTMTALTPRPTNRIFFAGAAVAIAEGFVSYFSGVDLNLLVLATLFFSLLDRLLVNGAIFESFVKLFSPGVQSKIVHHEAGHFLCAYLLGCPVEGCVLSAWAALQDARFEQRQVSAGTSFFDPVLSEQIQKTQVTRASIDRYSIIVMAGIAAEALEFGRADGGAGDEMALVAFLSQMGAVWNNDAAIRNQARWGALQAILILRRYRPCHAALVDALERGGTLKDCVHAIEKAGRDSGLVPMEKPLGYIVDRGPYGEWTTTKPAVDAEPPVAAADRGETEETKQQQQQRLELSREESLEKLEEYRKMMENRLKEIDTKLDELVD